MRSIQEIGDELYALTPAEFTAARDGYAAQARADGDRAAATAIAGLKRPTVSAWLVNVVALRRPELVARLIDLGATIRAAQGSVDAAGLRELSSARRQALEEAIHEATVAAAATTAAPTRQQLGEAEATFAAAMADEPTATLVREGRVLKAVVYSGFGDAAFGVPSTVSPPRPAGPPPAPPLGAPPASSPTGAPTAAHLEAAQRHQAAKARVAEAAEEVAAAAELERVAADHVSEVLRFMEELSRRLETAQGEAREARQARVHAERRLTAAKRELAGAPSPD